MSQKKVKQQRRVKQEEVGINEKMNSGETVGFTKIIKEHWRFLVGIVIGVILLYANSLGGNFVSDDYASITQNPDIKRFLVLFPGFNLVGFSKYLIAVIFGVESPVAFHVYSLFLYLVICCLVFVYAKLLTNKHVAFLTTIIFVVLPIHVEAVSWISGVPYLLVSLFTLLSLIYLSIYSKDGRIKSLMMAGLFFMLAFFSDRVRSFALIPLFLAYLVAYKGRIKVRIDMGKIMGGLLVGGVVMSVIMWPAIMSRLDSVNSGYNMSESIFYNPFFQYPTAITKYLQLMLVPTDLTLYHTMYVLPSWLNWIVLLTYLGAVGYFFVKNRVIFYALVFIFLATAPSMAPLKVSWLVAERYVFLGSFGFTLLLGILFENLAKKFKEVSYVVLVLLCALYGVRVILRNNDWSTNHKLWVNTVQVSPNSHNAWNNIGDDYDKLEDYENSIKGFTQSTLMKENYADAYHNRANIFFKIGRLDLARESYNIALYYSPELFQTYISLIQIDIMEGNLKLAEEHGKKLIELQPNNPQSYYVVGVVYAEMKNKEEASKLFKEALKISPQFTPAIEGIKQLSTI